MQKKTSLKILLCLLAVAALSVCVFIHSPKADAEGAITTACRPSDSDALIAALNDPQCKEIELLPSTIYYIGQPVSVSRSLEIKGSSSTIEFSDSADISVTASNMLKISNLSLIGLQSESIDLTGTLSLGEGVSFGGESGILMRSGSALTSGGATVSALEGLKALVTVEPSGGIVLLRDVRLNQVTGTTTMVDIHSGAGKMSLGGSVDILAADGTAVYCDPVAQGPEIGIEDGAVIALVASKSTIDQSSAVPGAAMYVRSCSLTIGTGARVGVTGSYCGIAARNITVEKDAIITAQCDSKSNAGSFECASLSASDKFICMAGSRITIGSSGSNNGTGIYGGQVEIEGNSSVIFRGNNHNSAAIYSPASVNIGANGSVSSSGGGYGIYCSALTTHEKVTVDVNGVSVDGIHADSTVKIGSNATVDISADRCAIYSKASVRMSSGGRLSLASAGDGPAVWLDSTAADRLEISGCQVTVTNSSSEKADKKAAVYTNGGILAENGSDITIINNGDFAVIAAGGNVSVSGKTVFRCSGSIGILVSSGSVQVTDQSTLLAEGLRDSAVRIERGSFSAASGSVIDIQGARFGAEVISGDFYIDGAASFDIRSTIDRAVYVTNGRIVIFNVDRISVWKRNGEQKNSLNWWKKQPEAKHSWDIPGNDKSNWLYADHTALSPAVSQQFSNGNPGETDFAWYDGAWSPSDYSRIGQFCSRPTGRANSYNIPAGKSFSWMLFGQSYDDNIKFSLKSSSGDGEFELLENGSFTYTAYDYTRGIQTFDFTVENSDGVLSEPATVSVFVTASKPPIAYSDTFPVSTSDAFVGQVNVMDYDGNIASIKVEEQPAHGSLLINSDGKFSYQPDEDFTGLDGFSYYAVDNMGDKSNLARVTLPVMMTGEMAVCNSTIVTESSTEESVRLVALLGGSTVEPSPQFVVTVPPVYGVVEFEDGEGDIITYIPYKDFSGTDSFSFAAVNDDGTLTAEGFVSIATIPSQRPSAAGGVFYCTRNSSCDGRLSGYDVDGQINYFNLTSETQNGEVEFDGFTGEFVYHPERGFIGTDRFSYTVTDSDGLVSEPVEVEIVVSSLIDNLRQTGRLGVAIILLCTGLATIGAIVALIVAAVSRRRKEEERENAKSRLFEYGGSNKENLFGYYDEYSNFDDYDR